MSRCSQTSSGGSKIKTWCVCMYALWSTQRERQYWGFTQKEICVKVSWFNFGLDWNQQLTANMGKHSGPPFLLSETQVLQGERGVNDCYLICQQHGSSRKVTLKSSCGHSMVPTARAYAGVCQEIQTAVSAVELWACLCGEACEFQIQVNVSPGKEISFVRCQLSVGCVAQPRPVAVETCSKLSLR